MTALDKQKKKIRQRTGPVDRWYAKGTFTDVIPQGCLIEAGKRLARQVGDRLGFILKMNTAVWYWILF